MLQYGSAPSNPSADEICVGAGGLEVCSVCACVYESVRVSVYMCVYLYGVCTVYMGVVLFSSLHLAETFSTPLDAFGILNVF